MCYTCVCLPENSSALLEYHECPWLSRFFGPFCKIFSPLVSLIYSAFTISCQAANGCFKLSKSAFGCAKVAHRQTLCYPFIFHISPQQTVSTPFPFQPAEQPHELRGHGDDPDDRGSQRVSTHALSSSHKFSVTVFSHRICPNFRTLTGIFRQKTAAPASKDAGAGAFPQKKRSIRRMMPPRPTA